MVHAPLSLHQCFSFGLCSCLKGVPLKNGEFRTTWLHCNHPAQVTALHDDVIPTIACLPLCLLVKVLARMGSSRYFHHECFLCDAQSSRSPSDAYPQTCLAGDYQGSL